MSNPATERALVSPVRQVILPAPIAIDRKRIFVNPPTIHIGSGDSRAKTIEWVNQTGGDIYIWLPNAHRYLIGKPEDFLKPFAVPNGGNLALQVSQTSEANYYHYNVYCRAIDSYAEGNSEPGVECP